MEQGVCKGRLSGHHGPDVAVPEVADREQAHAHPRLFDATAIHAREAVALALA